MASKRGQSKLNDKQRAFVIQQLACYSWPDDVAKMVREEFGIEISGPEAWQ